MAKKRAPFPQDVLRVRIRELRDRRGLSQQDLAERLRELGWEIHQTGVAKLEGKGGSRNINVDELFCLAWALDTSPTYLVTPDARDQPMTLVPRVQLPAYQVRNWMTGSYISDEEAPGLGQDSHGYILSMPEEERSEQALGLRQLRFDARTYIGNRLAGDDPETLRRARFYLRSLKRQVEQQEDELERLAASSKRPRKRGGK